MAEQRFERDLRAWLAADLDPVRGPHPRWAEAPAARRAAASRATPRRWRTVALLAAAAVGVVALALAVAVMPREIPVASAPPTLEPWPSAVAPAATPTAGEVAPAATPTAGEVALGRVAVVTANGEPALLVRASRALIRGPAFGGGGGVPVGIEVRVIGQLDRAFGIDRFIVVRGGRAEAPGLGVTAPDPLAISADAPIGTEVHVVVIIPAAADENVDLGFAGSGTSITFYYPVHRALAPPSLEGRCPTLEDYAMASGPAAVARSSRGCCGTGDRVASPAPAHGCRRRPGAMIPA